MDMAEWVLDQGGIVRTAALQRAGASRYEITRGREAGVLQHVTRGWVALPGADPLLVGAAQRNVVITCITQAERLGLWVLARTEQPHVCAPTHSGRAPVKEAVVHWGRGVVPRPPGALVDGIENVLVAVALCRDFETALAVWESALRRNLVTKEVLGRLRLPPAARRILDVAEVWSDSGLETLVVPRLRWMKLPLRRQIWLAGHRVDLLIGDRLVLQIDGGTHVGAQREADIAHDAALMLMGYHVIRVGYWQVTSDWASVQDRIMRAVAQGMHLAR